MMQTAVFVDAGYLFAQGSKLITGTRQPRDKLDLLVSSIPSALADAARKVAPDARLLRIYWYDGLIRGGVMTGQQSALARAANVKLRLGMVNSKGEQKGVDSLIVTDLIELARNQAISDAVIFSGDEDIRVGVQVAQTFGVRIHLIGIKPALGSQSPDLVAEADTHSEWQAEEVSACITLLEQPAVNITQASNSAPTLTEGEMIAKHVDELINSLGTQRSIVIGYIEANRGALPSNIDRPALAKLRDALERDLTNDERKNFRSLVASTLRSNTPA